MRVRCLTMGFACVSYLALGLAPTQVSAQLFRGSLFQQPAPNPAPAVPAAPAAPAAAPPQAPADPNPSATVTPPPPAGASQAQQPVSGQPERQGRIIRGSQLIGLNIRGSDDHQLGIVKDFIVDSQGECPMIYFAVEPDASLQLGQEYVIMPYSAMRYDSRDGRDYFALDVIGSGLRNAPRVTVNGWATFNDPQVLSSAHQFYQRKERTTARPIQGGAAQPKEQGTRPETPTRPDARTHPDSAPQPESAPRLDTNTQPKTAPPPAATTHPSPAAGPESGERPATGTRPEGKDKEPAEHVAPRR